MKGRFGFALGGLAIGILVATGTHRLWHEENSVGIPPRAEMMTTNQSEEPAELPDTARGAVPPQPITARSGSGMAAKPAANSAVETTQVASAVSGNELWEGDGASGVPPLPEPYRKMIAPRPAREPLSLSELLEAYSSESRDEAWAYPMEMGIRDFSSQRGAAYATSLEYVGCQGQYCVIAGVAYEGGQSNVNELFQEMTQRGWWQAFGGHSTTGTSDGEAYRFVSFFARKPEFFIRD